MKTAMKIRIQSETLVAKFAHYLLGGGRINMADIERMLRPREVALLFKVDPKTVTRWAKSGRLSPVVLPSGHRRYRMSDVETLINATSRRARPVGQHTCPRCGTSVRCSGGE